MNYRLKHRDILYNDEQLGPYPDHLLKRVDKITTEFVGTPRRKTHEENGDSRVESGKYGESLASEAGRAIQKTPIGASMFHVRMNMLKGEDLKSPVASQKAPIPDDPRVLSRHIKSFGYYLGADGMGICKIPEYAFFADDPKGKPYDTSKFIYAIVFAKRKSQETCFASNGHDWLFDSASHQCYQLLAVWTDTVAEYIRRLGYTAEASNMRNYLTVMTPLILAAGMGESSRMGLAVNPFWGPNFKAAAVLTDLPLLPDKPIDFGLQEYCRNCTICAEQCCAGAISRDPEKHEYNGYMTWLMDYDKCARFCNANKNGSVCGRCANICPWHRPNSSPSDFKDWDGDMSKIYDAVNARAAFLREHHFQNEEELTRQWWFDLEEIDGEMVIPKRSKQDILTGEEVLVL